MNRRAEATVKVIVSLGWKLSYRLDSLIDSFWARALQSDVFPVPGGPECVYRQRGKSERSSSFSQQDVEVFTMEKHNPVPGNQVAIDVFI